MANPFDDELGEFHVLQNKEGQYSLWPVWKEIPMGWHSVGLRGVRHECLDYIRSHWTDMRPVGLIEQMDRAAPAVLAS
jgi:MbtH protein